MWILGHISISVSSSHGSRHDSVLGFVVFSVENQVCLSADKEVKCKEKYHNWKFRRPWGRVDRKV